MFDFLLPKKNKTAPVVLTYPIGLDKPALNEFYATIFKLSPDPVVISILETGQIIDVNDASIKVFGFSREECVGKTTLELGVYPDPDERRVFAQKMSHEKKVRDYQINLRTKNGAILRVSVSGEIVQIDGKNCIVGIFRDVTQLVAELQKHKFTQFTVDHFVDGIFWISSQGKIMYANEAVSQSLGYSNEELCSMSVWDLDTPYKEQKWADHWQDLKKNGHLTIQSTHQAKDGHIIPVELTLSFILYQDKEFETVIVKNISDRIAAQKAITDSVNQYHNTIDAIDDLIHVIDRDYKFVITNKAVEDWMMRLGNVKNPAGENMFDVFPFLDAKVKANYDLVFTGGKPLVTDESNKIEDKIYYTETHLMPIFGDDGKVKQILTVIHDITTRKAALEAQHKAHEYLNNIINTIDSPVFVKDEAHKFTIMNEAMCRFMGHKREDLIGKSDYDFFPKDEADVFWAKDNIVFQNGELNVNEEYFTDAKGTKHTIITRKTLFSDAQANRFLVGIINDVSELREKDLELRNTAERMKILFENAPAAFYIHDMNGVLLDGNKQIEELTNCKKEELIGKNFAQINLLPPLSVEIALANLLKVKMGAANVEFEMELQPKDKEKIVCLVNAYSMQLSGKQVVFGVMHDISADKKAAQALKDQNYELSRLNKLMVGRELKMVELKEKLEKIQKI
jgi:PAS domain S-box-containing protein